MTVEELIQALTIDYNLVCTFNLITGKGHTLRVSEEKNRILGYAFKEDISFEEIMEHYVQTLVYELDQDLFRKTVSRENLLKVLSDRESYYIIYRTFRDGKMAYYELKVVRSMRWEERHTIVLGLRNVNDDTRREMEQKKLLEDALAEAKRAESAKTTFLSNMSHDLRTPMNAVIGFTNLAKDHMDDKALLAEYLDKILASGKQMLSMVNDVLDMSRIDSGEMQLVEEPCSMRDVLTDLAEGLRQEYLNYDVNLKMSAEEVLDDKVICDKNRITQVLRNILSNAAEYSHRGDFVNFQIGKKRLALSDEFEYVFSIQDYGIGMSPHFVAHIFDPFEREKNTTLSGVQGTGLGMAISKNIVDMMGGSINVNSWEGEGTEVVVTVPLKVVGADSDETTVSAYEATMSEDKAVTVLLVEDNPLNQEIAKAILEDLGFKVETADNGKICVDMVASAEPGYYDIILMDLQMPVMNGYEAARAIRAMDNESRATIPILVVSANAFDEDKEEAKRCGMNGHISKPIDIDKLKYELRRVLPEQSEAGAETHSGKGTRYEPEEREGEQVPLEEVEIFSYEKLYALFGNDETVKKLLESFVSAHKDDCDALRRCLDAQNYEGARPIIHSLIGVSGNFCLQRLCEASKKLRLQVHAGEVNCFDEFSAIWDQTLTEICDACERLGRDDIQ